MSTQAMTIGGAKHCFIPSFDPEGVLRAIEHYRITNLVLVPTMVNMTLNWSWGHSILAGLANALLGVVLYFLLDKFKQRT